MEDGLANLRCSSQWSKIREKKRHLGIEKAFRGLGLAGLPCFTTLEPEETTYMKNLGDLIYCSLHNVHVIHSASRNYTWKAGSLCVINGVGHYIEKSEGNSCGVIT